MAAALTDMDMVPRPYRSVVSIGAQCLTSLMLKNGDLKRFSGPFDWIFSNLRMVCDCIEDDFATYLDRDQMSAIPEQQRGSPTTNFAHHLTYMARYRIKSIFNHFDPFDPESYAYMERCVARFRGVLTSDHPALLLGVCQTNQGGLHGFHRLCSLLERYPQVEACVFIVREGAPARSVAMWEDGGRHRLIDLHVMSKVDGVHFTDQADNLFFLETLQRMICLKDADSTATAL